MFTLKIGLLLLFAVVVVHGGKKPMLSLKPTRRPDGIQHGTLFEAKKTKVKIIMVPILRDGTIANMVQNNISGHIVSGDRASLGQMPWQAALSITRGNNSFFCGGSLINVKWVITAAHCTFNTEKIIVRLGTLSPTSEGIAIKTSSQYTHPDYNPGNLNNDIGLVFLVTAVPLSSSIQVIPIVPNSIRSFSPISVSGWGKTKNTDIWISPKLLFAPVKIIKNSVCADTYGTKIVTNNTLCTVGNTRQSPCQGDSGGPLVLNGTTPYLVGIVSFVASTGCENGFPSGYINPANYRTWLKSVTGITF